MKHQLDQLCRLFAVLARTRIFDHILLELIQKVGFYSLIFDVKNTLHLDFLVIESVREKFLHKTELSGSFFKN